MPQGSTSSKAGGAVGKSGEVGKYYSTKAPKPMKGLSANNEKVMDYIKDQMNQGKMTAAEANVYKVRAFRVETVKGKLPQDVRKAYNAAVKKGDLGHLKKDGHKPEAYFHPSFKHLAVAARNKAANKVVTALKGVFA